MIVALVALGIALALAVAYLRSVDVLIRRQMRRQVIVELRSGETFRGMVASVDGRSVLLKSVELVGPAQAKTVPVDGELLIPRGDIKYLQRP